MKLSVASSLPFLVVGPNRKHQRAIDLFTVCQRTSAPDQQDEAWHGKLQLPAPANAKAKPELSQADLQKFVDCLLRPEEISGHVKVLPLKSPHLKFHTFLPRKKRSIELQ